MELAVAWTRGAVAALLRPSRASAAAALRLFARVHRARLAR